MTARAAPLRRLTALAALMAALSGCSSEPLPPPQPFCTRSLATVDCWPWPFPFGYYQREVADGPMQLTPEQERNRLGFWSWFMFVPPAAPL